MSHENCMSHVYAHVEQARPAHMSIRKCPCARLRTRLSPHVCTHVHSRVPRAVHERPPFSKMTLPFLKKNWTLRSGRQCASWAAEGGHSSETLTKNDRVRSGATIDRKAPFLVLDFRPPRSATAPFLVLRRRDCLVAKN